MAALLMQEPDIDYLSTQGSDDELLSLHSVSKDLVSEAYRIITCPHRAPVVYKN